MELSKPLDNRMPLLLQSLPSAFAAGSAEPLHAQMCWGAWDSSSQQPGTYPWRWCHKSSVSRAECCQSRARSQPSAGCPRALKAGPFCAAAVCTAAQTQPALPHTPTVMRCCGAGKGVQPTCCSVCGHGSQQVEHCGHAPLQQTVTISTAVLLAGCLALCRVFVLA